MRSIFKFEDFYRPVSKKSSNHSWKMLKNFSFQLYRKIFSFGKKIFYQMHLWLFLASNKNQGWNLALIFDRWRLIKYFFPNRFWRGLKKNVFLISLLISKEIRALRLFFFEKHFSSLKIFYRPVSKKSSNHSWKMLKKFFRSNFIEKIFSFGKKYFIRCICGFSWHLTKIKVET